MQRKPGFSRNMGSLKQAAKDDVKMCSVAAAECDIDARDDALIRVEPEPDTVVVLQVAEVQILAPQGDLACVGEQGGVEPGPDFEPVLALKKERVRAAEPVGPEASQRQVSPERREKIVGNVSAGVRLRGRDECASDQHTPLGEE